MAKAGSASFSSPNFMRDSFSGGSTGRSRRKTRKTPRKATGGFSQAPGKFILGTAKTESRRRKGAPKPFY